MFTKTSSVTLLEALEAGYAGKIYVYNRNIKKWQKVDINHAIKILKKFPTITFRVAANNDIMKIC